jgi:hypothetical protein
MEDFILPSIGGKVQKTREENLKGLFANLLLHAAHLFALMWSTHDG